MDQDTNNEIILSIAIPTYNRVKFLETAVNIFISQITAGGYEDKVEIVIGNDASPDESIAEYLGQLDEQYSFINTFTNPKNLGLSGNVEKTIFLAQGKYVWLFGDDDLITELSVKRLLDTIKKDDPNIILLNTANIISLDDKNIDYKVKGQNRLELQQDVFIRSLEQDEPKLKSVKSWLYLTNLVSASAFKKELFVKEIVEAKKYLRPENVYLFQAPLILGIAKWGRLKIIAERCVLHRKNETNWSGTIEGLFRVSLYDGSQITKLVKKYMPSEYKEYQKIFAVQTFIAIKRGKAKGEKITKNIIDAIKKYHDSFPYSIRFFLALVIPGSIFRLYKK